MGIQSYLEADIQSLSQEKLLVLLYEKMAHDLLAARQAMAAGDRVAMNDRLTHSQRIITELHSALDHSVGGEIPANLEALYDYLFAEHLAALVDQDPRHVDHCLAVIKPLLEAWRQIPAGTALEAARERERQQSHTQVNPDHSPAETGPSERGGHERESQTSSLFSVSA
jgi:flagellar protein FliS